MMDKFNESIRIFITLISLRDFNNIIIFTFTNQTKQNEMDSNQTEANKLWCIKYFDYCIFLLGFIASGNGVLFPL